MKLKNKRIKINDSKTILKGMNLFELEQWCKDNGVKKYRGTQIYEWMYKFCQSDPLKIKNIPVKLRNHINDNCIMSLLSHEKQKKSRGEKTTKFLFRLLDNYFIESVSMIEKKHHTVCLSSQVGCNLDCKFCSTATMGFVRNLSSGEIIEQLEYIKMNISKPITNVVFMGMGEPFLNYKNVIKAADIFHDCLGYGLSSNRITISTAGVVPKIKQFINENKKYKLAVSLNASTNKTRKSIMPFNTKWPIEDLIQSSKLFANRKRKNIMFEYVLLKNINDSIEDANKLMNLIKGINCKLNIIPYNETGGKYKRPENKTIDEFINILSKYQKKYGYRVLVRWSKGQDINAGCGQLAVSER